MTAWAVDTNVAVVANEGHHEASPGCVIACTDLLEKIRNGEALVVIDDGWEILNEYQRNLSSSGQPGPGDAFLKWLHQNLRNPNRCECVPLDPDESRGYRQFPEDPVLAGFDPSDRKFVAVALASRNRPAVANAVDSDWWEHREALAKAGVRVEDLCPDQVERWARERS